MTVRQNISDANDPGEIWALESAERSAVPEQSENTSAPPVAAHPNILAFLGHRCVQVKLCDDRHADGRIVPRVSSHFAHRF